MNEYIYQEYPKMLYHGLFAPEGETFQNADETKGLETQGWVDSPGKLRNQECCKAKEYEWCSGHPIVYKDSDDNEYCLFHATKGQKSMPLEKFNKYVFQRINELNRKNLQGACIECAFSGTIFEGDINFIQANQNNVIHNANFSEAAFHGDTSFSAADFIKFEGEAIFSSAIFYGSADFSEVEFRGDAYFYKMTFMKGADFTLVGIKESIRFEKVNLSKVTFIDTDLRKVNFIDCTFVQHNGDDILYDEQLLYEQEESFKKEILDITAGFLGIVKEKYDSLRIYSHPKYQKDVKDDTKQDIKKVEHLYRQLKQKYREEYNETEVSKWHYREKVMYRRGNHWRKYLPSITSLYWLFSGYGERPVRAGLALTVLLLIISLLFGFAGLHSAQPPVIKLEAFSNFPKVLLTTLQYALFERSPDFIPDTIWGKYLKILARIIIPLQTALFALAVRNRFRR